MLWGSKKELPLGIAWETDAMRVVELKRRGKGYQVGATRFPFPDGVELDLLKSADPSLLIDFLQAVKLECRWKQKSVVAALPHKQVIIRHLKMPSRPAEELAKGVEREINQLLGSESKNYSFDYMVIEEQAPEKGETQLAILLAAIPRQLAINFHNLFREAGFNLKAIDVAPLALKRALIRSAETKETERATVLLDLGRVSSQLVIISRGQLSFARVLSFCLPLDQETEKDKTGLLSEVRKTLDYFYTQTRERAGRVIVSGSGCRWPGLDFLDRDLGLEVATAVPGRGLALDRYPDPSFAVALGLALKGVRE